jgi:hypothetical protein
MATRRTTTGQGDPPTEEPTEPVDAATGQPADGPDSDPAGTDTQGGSDVPDNRQPPPQPPVLAPAPYYVATGPLFYGGGFGAMPVRAFNAGDRVPADLVIPNGWAAQVRHPDDDPDPAPAATTDATTAGQE